MDDAFIHLTAEEHMDDLIDLFKVLRKYGLKLSPQKCQFSKKKIVYMGPEFQIQEDKVCYTPLKDKCDAMQKIESPKTLRQTRAFCGMVNFLLSFLPNLHRLLIPVQTAIQRMSEKHRDFEIEPVNTIWPPEIEYTQTPQALVPIDTPLSIIHKHIPRQSDIDKIARNIETCIIHSLELPIQAQDLVKAYQHSTHFRDIYQYITDGKLPSSTKAQNCIRAKALNYVVINHFLFRIDT